ncbi:hypothetical protein [Chitinophaga sp. S165]|uniref:hypothetical protein n=1 Tax=Chitinophaga sp. S165 TaxID=2135462 RepID=UPI000D70B7F5|nr:hypothetical protein [Chitinophaga sp. S165]PWV48890.1 hypothetical protein C7475_106136 [Chitinophaga sp. S165]
MKSLFIIPVLLLLGIFSYGQLKTVSQSPVFGEEESVGIQRVLLMKNGNTFYLGLSKKALTVRVYSPKFTVKATKQLHPHLGKGSSFKVKGLYDMNGNVVVLVSAVDNHQVVLQRLVLDGKTGALLGEDKIGELEKVSYFKLAGVAFADIPEPDFFSEAMPEGNGYAVVAMNSFQPDRNKRVLVSIYGPDNKELSHAAYKSPEEKYKYMEYLGIAPLEKNKLGVLAYGYNTRTSGGRECELILGTLMAGDTSLVMDKLSTSTRPASSSLARYNPASKKIMLLEIIPKEGFSATVVDPYEKVARNRVLAGVKQSVAPQNLFPNEDGTFTIVYEELSIMQSVNMSKTDMEDYTVSVLSTENIGELVSYTIPRRHQRTNMMRTVAFFNAYTYFELAYKQASPLEAFGYLSAGGNNYLFLNDDVDNIRKAQDDKKLGKVTSIDDCDAFSYKLTGKNEVPAVDYLFEKPSEKRDHNLGLFKGYDYNAESKTYVVIKAEQRGKDWSWRLVWMRP